MFQLPVAIGSVAAWRACRLANEIGDEAEKTSAIVTDAPSWSSFNDVFAISLKVPNNVIASWASVSVVGVTSNSRILTKHSRSPAE
jgi:hypothetical protein